MGWPVFSTMRMTSHQGVAVSRQPRQVLVLPARVTGEGRHHYLVLHRSDMDVWQGVAGGVEDNESDVDAAYREVFEELGHRGTNELIMLDTFCSMPAGVFEQYRTTWPPGVFTVAEKAFGYLVEEPDGIVLSTEHDDARWVEFDTAMGMLTWDSNTTALWEFRERLTSGTYDRMRVGDPDPQG